MLNLPGSTDYNPNKLWVYMLRLDNGRIAADLLIFVDDLRPTGPSQKEAWLAVRRAAISWNSRCTKKEECQLTKPRGLGGRCDTNNKETVFVLTSQEKWDKAKAHIE
jgi:hypothetical protein